MSLDETVVLYWQRLIQQTCQNVAIATFTLTGRSMLRFRTYVYASAPRMCNRYLGVTEPLVIDFPRYFVYLRNLIVIYVLYT